MRTVDERRDVFLVERYKYILAQKQALNAGTFKVVTAFQAGLGLIVSGQFVTVGLNQTGTLSDRLAVGASFALYCLFLLLSAFALFFLGSGLNAWLAYREDEAAIELEVFGRARPMPRLRDCISWYETYLIIVIVFILMAYSWIFFQFILPVANGSGGVHL